MFVYVSNTYSNSSLIALEFGKYVCNRIAEDVPRSQFFKFEIETHTGICWSTLNEYIFFCRVAILVILNKTVSIHNKYDFKP